VSTINVNNNNSVSLTPKSLTKFVEAQKMPQIVKEAQDGLIHSSLRDKKIMTNSQQQLQPVGPPAKPSPFAIPRLSLPPYFQSGGISINPPSIEYEFEPQLDINFSFLANDKNARRYPLLKGKYGIFDFEWQSVSQVMLCATFSDNLGNKVQRHIEDFPVGGEEDLLRWIIRQIKSYVLTFGWNSTSAKSRDGGGIDSDLAMLHKRCKNYKIPSIVEIRTPHKDMSYAAIKDTNHVHIDVFKTVINQIMIGVNKEHGIIYNTHKLGDVSIAYGYGGKLGDLTGVEAVARSKEELLAYNANDVDMTRQILQHNNYEILDLFYLISKISKISFNLACHSGPTIAWASVIDNSGFSIPKELPMMPYQGALVFDPEHGQTVGDYRNIYSVDFASLYPNCIIHANLSPETICCECCKDNPEARLPVEIMEDINSWVATDEKSLDQVSENNKHLGKQTTHAWRIWYWICRKHRGLLPSILEAYVKERMKYKKTDYALQYCIKIMMNSLYGCCGTYHYKYRDVRVAELCTAFARRSLTTLCKIATEEFALRELYSDTDSIMLQGIRNSAHFEQFQQACKDQLEGLELEPKLFEQFLLIDSKSYIATYHEKDKKTGELKLRIEKKGLQGAKSDVCKWIQLAVEQFVNNYVNNEPTKCISDLKQAHDNLLKGRVPKEHLVMYEKVGQDPKKYAENHHLRRLALEEGITQGGRVWYYYSIEDDGKYEANPKEISIDRYMEDFKTAFEKLVNLLDNCKYNYYQDIIGIDEQTFKENQKAKDRRKKQDPYQGALI
jgi:DNA polymerase elongation subunit (family B)